MARVGPGNSAFLSSYLPYLLRRADQTLSAPFYEVLTRSGVARSEWRVLAVLDELGDLGVIELADATLSPQPTVTHAVRRLEDRGLVKRSERHDDRRYRPVSITDRGSALTGTLVEEANRLQAAALRDAGDLTDLIGELLRVTEAVETAMQHPDDSPEAAEVHHRNKHRLTVPS